MSRRVKISEFKPFVGKALLLEADRRGQEIATANGEEGLEPAGVLFIGLAALLEETGLILPMDKTSLTITGEENADGGA